MNIENSENSFFGKVLDFLSRNKIYHMAEQRFELLVDGVPYSVEASSFEYNSETRYRVNYAGNEHIFTWDPSLGRLAPINDDAAEIPDNLENEIARKLFSAGRI